MKKTHILYGLEAAGGGALKHLVYLVSRLDKTEFDITVVLSKSRKIDITEELEKMHSAGAKVFLLPICRSVNPVKDFIAICQLVSLIQKGKYDIVHAHSSKAGALFRLGAWISNVSIICYTPHCFYFQGKVGFKRFLFLYLEKILAKITNYIIVSEGEYKEIIKSQLAHTSKIVNINNAIDFDEYKQSNLIKEIKAFYGIKPNAFVVGAIGRLVPQKDWETYIYVAREVLKKHPETIFLISGEGPLFKEIQELIYNLNLDKRVILTGHIKEIYRIYSIIDLFVNTSLWEGLPYVFLEAMKYEKAIIATDTGNETTIINNETGYISPTKDFKYISEKIINLIENKQIAIQMGQKGRERLLQKYSFDCFIEQHRKLYRSGISRI